MVVAEWCFAMYYLHIAATIKIAATRSRSTLYTRRMAGAAYFNLLAATNYVVFCPTVKGAAI